MKNSDKFGWTCEASLALVKFTAANMKWHHLSFSVPLCCRGANQTLAAAEGINSFETTWNVEYIACLLKEDCTKSGWIKGTLSFSQ